MSIRWKLFTTYLAVLLVALGALSIYLDKEMSQYYVESLDGALASQARLIGDALGPSFGADTDLQARVTAFGQAAGTRVTLIDPSGIVLADNEHIPQTMENHAYRLEVREALTGGEGSSIRHSGTLNVDMLYVAVPVKHDGKVLGVVRLATPLYQVSAAQGRLRKIIVVSAVIALMVSLLLSLWLTHGLSAGIRELGKTARRFAAGDLTARARIEARDRLGRDPEITQLAATLNEVADRLTQSLRQMAAEKQRTDTLLEQVGEAILVTDQSGCIVLCNTEAERLLNLTSKQAIGLSLLDATQDVSLDTAVREALSGRPAVSIELRFQFPRRRTIEATVTALTSEDRSKAQGTVVVLHDVTELRRLEAVRREFVANASHELQTPVTAIKALVEALMTGGRDDPETVERFLLDIEQQADRMGSLVRDLLDLARIEARSSSTEVGEANVAEVIRSVVKQFDAFARQQHITVEVDIPDDLCVHADWFALNRIFSNLLDNALKYTEPGGRTELRAMSSDNQVIIRVRDTGIGILSDDLPRIFERFYRVDQARSREAGGTGLGLSIVRHLVEMLGGRIDVQSQFGTGSEFTVTLPAASQPRHAVS